MGNLVGKINCASSDAADVVPNADIIIICSPAHTKFEILRQIQPYLKKGTLIGSIFGQGGFDFQCQTILKADIQIKELTIFSL
jgi:ketol-acid reductoisomerase